MPSEASPNAAPAHDSASVASPAPPRRRFLRLLRQIVSWGLLLFVIAGTAGIAWVRVRALGEDFAGANVVTVILMFPTLVALMGWILLRTGVTLLTRLIAMGAIIVLICAPLLTLRMDGFSGSLVPILRWRWTPKPVPLSAAPSVAADSGKIDMTTRTADDVPQFLGPHRSPDLPHVLLVRDWDAHPPQELWRRPIGAGWSGFSVVNGYAVTMEQRGPEEMVTCYDVRDGRVLWAHGHAARHETVMGGLGPRSTPTIDEGMVYALGATGVLRCIDGSTGKLVWSEDILRRFGVTPAEDQQSVGWGRAGSPLVVEDVVIVPFGGPPRGPRHSLAAYAKKTGQLRWQGGDRQVSFASPSRATLLGIDQVVLVNEDCVSGHRWEDGGLIWSYPWPGSSNRNASCSQAVALPGDRVLLTKGYGVGAELIQLVSAGDGLLRGERIWADRRLLKTKFTNAVVRDGFVYGLSDGIMECVELETGHVRWKHRRGSFGHGQVLGVGDVLLVQAESGEVVLLDMNPDDLVELGRLAALSEKTWNTPCLYGSLLLVRNAAEAVCYRLALRKDG